MHALSRQSKAAQPSHLLALRRAVAAGLLSLFLPALQLHAQGAIDPNVAPRAAALEREGERHMAIDLLGRYLATAPDDGRAWLQLGRFYLSDSRDWHLHGHRGEPNGLLYLDFAATALEQSIRLAVDSGLIFRGIAEVDRALVLVEEVGWGAARTTLGRERAPAMPPFVLELGQNLLASCPAGGVLLTGSELEALSVWYGTMERPSLDVLPIRPDLYATDSLYRLRMAYAMGVDPALPVQRALGDVAPRRPLCLSPGTDSAAVPALAWLPYRLVRLSRPAVPGPEAMSINELLKAVRQNPSPWVVDVRGVYDRAATHNLLLCSSLVLLFGDTPPPACQP
jgi:hypothetical protein